MSDRTATPARGTQRAKTARRGGLSGRLVVGEYVGQVAGEAAQAVRRAGLRPGLDRSFGCEAELIGLVVAQEPPAGSDLARNGMVTLYVATPGNAPVDESTDAPETIGDPPGSAPAAPALADIAQAETLSAPARARRPRKPGLAGRAAQVFDPPPAPVPPDRGPADDAPAAPVAQLPPGETWGSPGDTYALDDKELDEEVFDERGEDEFSHDEFVVHMGDVLAGRAGWPRAWRRVYPRRRVAGTLDGDRGVRAWLAEHPRLVKAVGTAFAVWAVVGLAAALDGHHARAPTASVISGGNRRAGTRTAVARDRASARRVRTVRPAARSPRPHVPPEHSGVPRRRRASAPASEAAARPEGASVRATPAPPPPPTAAPTAASAPPPPAPEQTQGGPFSP
jgi:PASTA domain